MYKWGHERASLSGQMSMIQTCGKASNQRTYVLRTWCSHIIQHQMNPGTNNYLQCQSWDLSVKSLPPLPSVFQSFCRSLRNLCSLLLCFYFSSELSSWPQCQPQGSPSWQGLHPWATMNSHTPLEFREHGHGFVLPACLSFQP